MKDTAHFDRSIHIKYDASLRDVITARSTHPREVEGVRHSRGVHAEQQQRQPEPRTCPRQGSATLRKRSPRRRPLLGNRVGISDIIALVVALAVAATFSSPPPPVTGAFSPFIPATLPSKASSLALTLCPRSSLLALLPSFRSSLLSVLVVIPQIETPSPRCAQISCIVWCFACFQRRG
ncbi:hypothetical protein V496_06482 [Pseudogymnoascus sp. VKM F-4515 (FW-2607)]|nr:hypothetical protein V496_06482 [Pseudogymnoascus sp. VKM F-4515 (FW-2607)]